MREWHLLCAYGYQVSIVLPESGFFCLVKTILLRGGAPVHVDVHTTKQKPYASQIIFICTRTERLSRVNLLRVGGNTKQNKSRTIPRRWKSTCGAGRKVADGSAQTQGGDKDCSRDIVQRRVVVDDWRDHHRDDGKGKHR